MTIIPELTTLPATRNVTVTVSPLPTAGCVSVSFHMNNMCSCQTGCGDGDHALMENGAIPINWLIDNGLPFSSLCHLLPLESNLLLCLCLASSDCHLGCWMMICSVWPYWPCACSACPPWIWICPGGTNCICCKTRVPDIGTCMMV